MPKEVKLFRGQCSVKEDQVLGLQLALERH